MTYQLKLGIQECEASFQKQYPLAQKHIFHINRTSDLQFWMQVNRAVNSVEQQISASERNSTEMGT